MAGMPKMQEHFSASAMDGRHTENAGAFSASAMDGRHTENAGAFFGWRYATRAACASRRTR
jgi:hypothetical protein